MRQRFDTKEELMRVYANRPEHNPHAVLFFGLWHRRDRLWEISRLAGVKWFSLRNVLYHRTINTRILLYAQVLPVLAYMPPSVPLTAQSSIGKKVEQYLKAERRKIKTPKIGARKSGAVQTIDDLDMCVSQAKKLMDMRQFRFTRGPESEVSD